MSQKNKHCKCFDQFENIVMIVCFCQSIMPAAELDYWGILLSIQKIIKL